MPMRIVNLNGGGGGSVGSKAGLFEFFTAPKLNVVNPDSSKYVSIWDDTTPRPVSLTVMIWGPGAWQTHSATATNRPPDCGAAFGIVTLYGEDIPQKLYYWRGSHEPNFPYGYSKSRTFGFNSSPTRDDAWLLPNPTGNKNFNNTDFIAPDAVAHHWGEWDAVYNGGNGHFWTRQTSDAMDSPGSNGSPFGTGKTSTGKYPASCGAGGTDSGRGAKAKGINSDVMAPLGGLRAYGVEIEPENDKLDIWGGGGGFDVVIRPNAFGIVDGIPFKPETSVVRIDGGPPPIDRFDTNTRNYFVSMYALIEHAK